METPKYSRAEVASHNTKDDLWLIVSNNIYDVTEFQEKHPGGKKILKAVAGKDATKAFKKNHNERILTTEQYRHLCIGTLEEEVNKRSSLSLSGVLSWRRRSKDAESPKTVEPIKETTRKEPESVGQTGEEKGAVLVA